jgi:hypothetical protein
MAGMGPPLGYIRVPLTPPTVAEPPGIEVGVGPAPGLAPGPGGALGGRLVAAGPEEVAEGAGCGVNCSAVLSPQAMPAAARRANPAASLTRLVTNRH